MNEAPLTAPSAPPSVDRPPRPARTEAPGSLIIPANVAEPLPFAAYFDAQQPVEVDVGCGKGRFLLARAAAHPEVQFLGIERLLLRVRKIDRKAQRAGLTNLHLVRLEASYTLRFLLPPHRIRTFYIFFPDPWPKRRHHKRRLFSPEFREALWSRLETGGTLQIATDHLDYFAAIQRGFRADPRFRELPPMERTAEEQTDFELIFRGQGLPIGACAFEAREAGTHG